MSIQANICNSVSDSPQETLGSCSALQTKTYISCNPNDPECRLYRNDSGEIILVTKPFGEVIGENLLRPLIDKTVKITRFGFGFFLNVFELIKNSYSQPLQFFSINFFPLAAAEPSTSICADGVCSHHIAKDEICTSEWQEYKTLIYRNDVEDFLAELRKLFNEGRICDINQENPSNGQTLLHYAADVPSKPKIVRELLKLGAEIDHKDFKGNTPLKIVTERYSLKGHDRETAFETIKTLVENGANVNAVNKEGRSLLHGNLSWFYHPYKLVAYLIEAESDPNIQDINGNLPSDDSIISNDKELILALLKGQCNEMG